jgi:hypothetical protein
MDRHDPRRNDALGLVRRLVRVGNFTKSDVDRWRGELGDVVVDDIVQELAPKKTAKKAPKKAPKKADPVEPEKE